MCMIFKNNIRNFCAYFEFKYCCLSRLLFAVISKCHFCGSVSAFKLTELVELFHCRNTN